MEQNLKLLTKVEVPFLICKIIKNFKILNICKLLLLFNF
jgi:hypothetical protein